MKTLPEFIGMAVRTQVHHLAEILFTLLMQLAGWAVLAPVAALVAYCSVHAVRAAICVFKKKPL